MTTSRQDQIARADGDGPAVGNQQRTAMLVDAVPRAADGARAEVAGDAVASGVDGEAAPLAQPAIAIESLREARIDMFDERLRGHADAAHVALRVLGDGDDRPNSVAIAEVSKRD